MKVHIESEAESKSSWIDKCLIRERLDNDVVDICGSIISALRTLDVDHFCMPLAEKAFSILHLDCSDVDEHHNSWNSVCEKCNNTSKNTMFKIMIFREMKIRSQKNEIRSQRELI